MKENESNVSFDVFQLATALRKIPDTNNQKKTVISALLSHIMKILSIYFNVLNNKRPVFIPKGQKADIFINSKELQLINSYGYFGNDYFYLKIYKILRIIYENHKVIFKFDFFEQFFVFRC